MSIRWNAGSRIRLLFRGLGLSRCPVRTCLRCQNPPCKAHVVSLHHLTTNCKHLYRYGPPLV